MLFQAAIRDMSWWCSSRSLRQAFVPSSDERSTAATFVAAGASSSGRSACAGRCMSCCGANGRAAAGRCASIRRKFEKLFGLASRGPACASTSSRMWARTCTCWSAPGDATLFNGFCEPLRGSSLGPSPGREGAGPCGAGPFWSALAWSRVVAWGRDYWGVRHYVFRNRIEATDGPAIRRALEHGPAP